MKVILSRKGFDSGAGGDASPILPDSTLLSLPIPDDDEASPVAYCDLKISSGVSYLKLMKQLPIKGAAKYTEEWKAHLDPDLQWHKPENPEWLPAFGQSNGPWTHLIKQGVGLDDLFLFFGWFRKTKWNNNKIIYEKNAPDLHIIWGYL